MSPRLLFIIGAFLAGVMLPASADAAAARTTTALNMRTGPSTGYAVITVIPGGGRVEIIGRSGGWCHVDYRGYRGWSSCRYLGGVAYAPRYVYPQPRVGVYLGFPSPWIFRHDHDYRRYHRSRRPKYRDYDRRRWYRKWD